MRQLEGHRLRVCSIDNDQLVIEIIFIIKNTKLVSILDT